MDDFNKWLHTTDRAWGLTPFDKLYGNESAIVVVKDAWQAAKASNSVAVHEPMVPVYQIMTEDGNWLDVSEDTYEMKTWDEKRTPYSPRSYCAHSTTSQVPDGMKLVPIEPTEVMKRALFISLANADDEAMVIKSVMAAAPTLDKE